MKTKIFATISIAILVCLLVIICFMPNNQKSTETDSRSIKTDIYDEIVADEEEASIDNLVDMDIVYTINNTAEEIIANIADAQNGDKVGKVSGKDIFVLKCPQLTSKSLLYSEDEVPVLYGDYICVKYAAEKENEQCVILVYYFDSNDMWEAWYKYIIADSVRDVASLAEVEKENGYAVWEDNNIILLGEQFLDITISKEEFLNEFLKQFETIIDLNQ